MGNLTARFVTKEDLRVTNARLAKIDSVESELEQFRGKFSFISNRGDAGWVAWFDIMSSFPPYTVMLGDLRTRVTVIEALRKHTPTTDVGNALDQQEIDSIALAIAKATEQDPEGKGKEKD